MISRHRRSFPRAQRGAVVVYVVIAISALLTGSFAAFEVGRIYLANRQIQKMASLAALDAVREVSACDRSLGMTPAEIRSQLEQRVSESLIRNGGSELVSTLDVDIDTGTLEAASVTRNGATTRQRRLLETDASQIESADAVRVTLRAPFPGFLTKLFTGDDSRRMEVSATAEQPLVGTFSIGSGLASLNEGALNAILGATLGGDVNLSLVDYNGLADVNVTVEDLALALGLTVADLSDPLALAVQSPVLSDTLDALADGLSGTISASTVAAIRELADLASNTDTTTLDNLIAGLGGVPGDATVGNLLDVISALAQATNADPSGTANPIAVDLPVNVAGLSVNTFLKIIEPPVLGAGKPGSPDAVARTAQIRLMVRIDGGPLLSGLTGTLNGLINTTLGLIGSLTGVVTTINVATELKIGVDVEVARASAFLDRISCPQSGVNNGNPIAQLSGETGVATVIVASFSGNAADAPDLDLAGGIPVADVSIDARNLRLLGLPIGSLGHASLSTSLDATSLGVSQTGPNTLPMDVTEFEKIPGQGSNATPFYEALGIPPDDPVDANPQDIASSTSVDLDLGLSTTTTGSGLTGGLVGLIGSLVNTIQVVVQPLLDLVNGLASSLIDPLLGALGVQTGTGQVVMRSITVDRPIIATTQRIQDAQ